MNVRRWLPCHRPCCSNIAPTRGTFKVTVELRNVPTCQSAASTGLSDDSKCTTLSKCADLSTQPFPGHVGHVGGSPGEHPRACMHRAGAVITRATCRRCEEQCHRNAPRGRPLPAWAVCVSTLVHAVIHRIVRWRSEIAALVNDGRNLRPSSTQ